MNNYQALDELINEYNVKGQLVAKKDYPLSSCCTFKIGGKADYVLYPKSAESLIGLLDFVRENNIKYCLLGNASNILFADSNFNGAVIFTSMFNSIRVNGSCISAESGASMCQIVKMALKNGLSGFEFAYGIPGTCGGGVYMNAGAFENEIKDVLESSTYYTPSVNRAVNLTGPEHEFGYRRSYYTNRDYVILSAKFQLHYENPEIIKERMDKYMKCRTDKQPIDYPSAGSVFKRCTGYYPAQLIDEAGLKGYKIGGAQISTKHTGFIVNTGDATSEDVLQLIDFIKDEIKKRNGIDIECEIKYVSG